MIGVAAGKTNLLRYGVRVEHEGAVKHPFLLDYTSRPAWSQRARVAPNLINFAADGRRPARFVGSALRCGSAEAIVVYAAIRNLELENTPHPPKGHAAEQQRRISCPDSKIGRVPVPAAFVSTPPSLRR